MTASLDPKQFKELVAMFERMAALIDNIGKELKRANDREEKR